jgi:hypothetical protein
VSRRADGLYANPASVAPECYDPAVNTEARTWFEDTATDRIAVTAE